MRLCPSLSRSPTRGGAGIPAHWLIHFCVLLWGFTSILGKLISLPALPLVWWRMFIVVAAVAAWPGAWRGLRKMPGRRRAAYAGVGVLVGLHWLTFYGAIKLADASVGATCIALATAFTAVIEPAVAGARFSWKDLALGVAVLPGVALVVGGVPGSMRLGVAVGAVSALLVAVFGSLNKRLVHGGDAVTVTWIELAAGTLALTFLGPLLPWVFAPLAGPLWVLPGPRDALLLAALAFGCTLLPFALALVALRRMSAFAAQLAVNLEPVYAVVLAAVLLGEQRELTGEFYLGVAIILGAVIAYPLLARAHSGVALQADVLATAEAKQVAEVDLR